MARGGRKETAVQESDREMEDFQPPKKKPRFKTPATDQQMEEIKKGYVPQNTQKNTATAARTSDDEFDELVSSIDLDIC